MDLGKIAGDLTRLNSSIEEGREADSAFYGPQCGDEWYERLITKMCDGFGVRRNQVYDAIEARTSAKYAYFNFYWLMEHRCEECGQTDPDYRGFYTLSGEQKPRLVLLCSQCMTGLVKEGKLRWEPDAKPPFELGIAWW